MITNRSIVTLGLVLAFGRMTPVGAAIPVMVQDFEQVSAPPTAWVVNIPNENASVQLSTDQPYQGKQCLNLHYHFVGTGSFQYLGIPNKVRIQGPLHDLHFWLKGDNSKCSYGLQVTDALGETHQYRSLSTGQGQGGIIDFTGWKEVVFDLIAPHETWGGDKNGKLNYPLTGITLTIGQPQDTGKLLAVESDLFFDALSVDSEMSAAATLGGQVSVILPAYGSDVKGDTPIQLAAPGFKSVSAKCWKQSDGFGADSTVPTVALDAKGIGAFVFPADAYPHGPITVRISGDNGSVKDNCYLQLYNRGGVPGTKACPKNHRRRPKACRWSLPMTSTDLSPFPAPRPRPLIMITNRRAVGTISVRFASPVLTNPITRSARYNYLRILANERPKAPA